MTALHGFLGRPSDWDGIFEEAWTRPDWLQSFEGNLLGAAIETGFSSQGDVLLGYSMGGRLALHMVLEEPCRWRKVIIVSASPGLIGNSERESRLRSDANWAIRFLNDPWEEVVEDWNTQPVFAYDPPDRLPRLERDYDREVLATTLVGYSIARQANLRERLRAIDVPILWIAGRKDAKYAALAEECAALNPLFGAKILDAGHRVPWGDPGGFRSAVDDFITIRT